MMPVFLASAYTGVELHLAGHDGNHDVWHGWAVAHVVACLLFLVAVVCHVETHRRWYKRILTAGVSRKNGVTVAVSVLFLVLALTGLALLGVEGGNSGLGLWHYKAGLFSIVIFLWHITQRLPALIK